ncbi:MAG: 2-C-methyl-D-erythritol 4-phosphate cytidylyltransferase [Humidesulfovibrio sp.]|uniref:2-C-methyl-D-erythritol 4-phosphate cytidylyltransferase n=1 Tax=Humidesulfovibrio sp. TaxID=2910988 RepID=UPI0027F767C1|nr:2-C-methyl-D-erythritol 4-phosphate cytidylyltransferase [Humidesulfovibrio sp.]MDQ7835394.1 2-C-methyl-D-erythritol 4-phosphate cytidylyltransferase [Humidesulfovibrio sp.]
MPSNSPHNSAAPLWAVLLAAGSGTRLAQALTQQGGDPVRKQYLDLNGAPLFWQSARTLSRVQAVTGLVFVFPPQDLERMGELVAELDAAEPLGLPWLACSGGERRQDSVRLGLESLPADCKAVLVHDSARPFATAALARRVAQALTDGAQAAIPGLAVTDTIKAVDHDNVVVDTPDRATLRAVQTPQGFLLAPLAAAHRRAQAEAWEVTDDAALMERCGHPVLIVPGEERNVKITNPADLALLSSPMNEAKPPRTGWGYDVHRYLAPGEASPKVLAKARPMMLGGIGISGAPQVIAHSDGDVLLHALTDALLGIACAGDIGQLFPDTDDTFDNMPSAVFVTEALRRVRALGYRPVHADLTVIAQVPKLAPHKARMAAQIAQLLELPASAVNVKATTEEGLGFTGEKRGIKATAIVTALPG